MEKVTRSIWPLQARIGRVLRYSAALLVGFLLLLSSFLNWFASPVFAVNPDEISDLTLWLDASQGVTSDGTTPAVDGDTVQQWGDQSTSAAHATQATPASRPIYKTNVLNGRSVIRFTGAESLVTAPFLDSTYDSNFTFFIIADKSSGSSLNLSTSNQINKWYSGRDTNSVIHNANNLSPFQSRLYLFSPKDNLDWAIESFRYNGATETMRFDDIIAGTTNTRIRNASGNLGLSGALTIGQSSGGGFAYRGDIAEIIIYNRALTDAELVQVAQYLSGKYDASARTLPAMPDPGLSLPFVAFDGDSMTAGYGSTDDQTYPNQAVSLLGGTDNYSYINLGIGGQTVAQMTTDAASEVDSLLQYGDSRPQNTLVLMGGTNDLGQAGSIVDAATTYDRIVTYAQARQAAGWTVIVNTILPRSATGTPADFETKRQTVNSLIRANWETFADGISDVAADSRIGDAGDELDATYYTDKVHMTNSGYGIVASYVAAAINQVEDPIGTSDVLVTPSTTSSTVTWSTNQPGSTKVNYGLSSAYGSSTVEIDTATRVLAHSVTLSDLVACTTYHYQTISSDPNGNATTSSDQTFTTLGCTGSASVSAQTGEEIASASGGSLSLLSDGKGLTLTVPSAFAASDANFQVKQLDKAAVTNITSTPSGYALVGSYLYDLKALTDPSALLTTFDQPLTVKIAYGTGDLAGIDESSLRIFRWDGSMWSQLSACTVDASVDSVTCTTQAFSVFALFGTGSTNSPALSSGDSAAARPSSCSDQPPGSAPDLFQIDRIGHTARLYFAPAIQPYTRYIIAYGVGDRTEQYGVQFDTGYSSGVIDYTINELDSSTIYSFRVQAANGCAPGDWSNVLKASPARNTQTSFYRVGGSSNDEQLLSSDEALLDATLTHPEPTPTTPDITVSEAPEISPNPSPSTPKEQSPPNRNRLGLWQWFLNLFK